MNNGAFDFATKPIDLDDLSVTIEKAIEQINYIREKEQEHNQLESIKGDLAVAGEIQLAILPSIFPPFPEETARFDISATMRAAKDVGGDFYDFFRIDQDHIGFVIADVSGKGVPAAIFMAVSRTLIKATALRGVSPSECLTYSNKLLEKESVNCMFVTVFYGIYQLSTGQICYCNAGHNSPFLVKTDGSTEELPLSNDPIVGVIPEAEFHEHQIQLEQGETLLLFTDGVTEAMNSQFEEFGEQRLSKTIQDANFNNCQELIDVIKSDLSDFVGQTEQSDDITMLAIKRLK